MVAQKSLAGDDAYRFKTRSLADVGHVFAFRLKSAFLTNLKRALLVIVEARSRRTLRPAIVPHPYVDEWLEQHDLSIERVDKLQCGLIVRRLVSRNKGRVEGH